MKTINLLTTIAVGLVLMTSARAGSNEDLISACQQGDISKVRAAITSGADVNWLDANGNTAICAAYLWPDITQVLIDEGADVNAGNYPAVISAANNYSVDVLTLLIANGADVNKPGKIDPGAGLRKMLADEKAKGKKANKAMVSAWEDALKNLKPAEVRAIQQTVQQTNCVPCLETLLKNGAEVNLSTDGNLLHTIAVFGMSREQRRDAFAKGKDAMASYGMIVPDWYANLPDDKNGTSGEMVTLLVEAGLDPNELNSGGNSPLLSALATRKTETALGLVMNGADVTVKLKNNQKDAVSHAAEIGDLALLKAIVEKGADVNYETWDLDQETGSYCKGFTPLTRAVIYNHYECVQYLLENGAEIKEGISGYFSKEARSGLRGNGPLLTTLTGRQLYCRYKLKNKMAIYFAIENGNLEMVKLLASSFGWFQNHSMEMKAQVGSLDDTSALKGACVAASGKFTPSRYAKSLEQKEIQKYLESEGK